MVDPLSLAVLSMTTSLAGLVMRGAAVAVDPSWGSAASLPGDALNAWRSLRRLQQGRGGLGCVVFLGLGEFFFP